MGYRALFPYSRAGSEGRRFKLFRAKLARVVHVFPKGPHDSTLDTICNRSEWFDGACGVENALRIQHWHGQRFGTEAIEATPISRRFFKGSSR